MRRLSLGDEGAFLEFYRRHQGGLYRFAFHMAGRHEAAADIVQETFLALIRNAGRFDEEKGAPAAFLYGIARNQIRKLRDKESRYVPLAEEVHAGQAPEWDGRAGLAGESGRRAPTSGRAETVLDSLEHAEIVKLLRQAVLTLPDHYREPVTLCDLEGKSYGEAASVLGCPVGTVRSRLNRARSILLEKLRPARMGTRAMWARSGGKV